MGTEAELMELVHGIALWALIACAAAVAIGLGAWAMATVRADRAQETSRPDERRGKPWDR